MTNTQLFQSLNRNKLKGSEQRQLPTSRNEKAALIRDQKQRNVRCD